MSDDNQKLFQRLAAMEQELATLRAAPKRPEGNPDAWKQALVTDPIGAMRAAGLPVDHITRVLVASALGDQAPPELRVLAAMGPQVSATAALQAKVDELSRQLSDQSSKGSRESKMALARDATKYPNLAKALAADPTLFDDELAAHGGSAEDFASTRETRLARVAAVYSPPPASENADTKNAQSNQGDPATSRGGDPPPLPRAPSGVLTSEEDAALKAEIIRKYSSQAPQ